MWQLLHISNIFWFNIRTGMNGRTYEQTDLPVEIVMYMEILALETQICGPIVLFSAKIEKKTLTNCQKTVLFWFFVTVFSRSIQFRLWNSAIWQQIQVPWAFRLLTIFLFPVHTMEKRKTEKGKLSTTETPLNFKFQRRQNSNEKRPGIVAWDYEFVP